MLVGSTGTHTAHADKFAAGPKTCQLGVVVFIEVDSEVAEGTVGKRGENLPGTLEQRRLLFAPVALDGPLQHGRGRTNADIRPLRVARWRCTSISRSVTCTVAT